MFEFQKLKAGSSNHKAQSMDLEALKSCMMINVGLNSVKLKSCSSVKFRVGRELKHEAQSMSMNIKR